MTAWNPRYVAYAAAHNKSPKAMLAHDEEAWPGGKLTGFILWISAARSRWIIARSRRRPAMAASSRYPLDAIVTEQDHNDFTAWLQRAPKEIQ